MKSAARCVCLRSALRWPVQRAAMAVAPHRIICPGMQPCGGVERHPAWAGALGCLWRCL
ncbi:MAG: hypothetical protein SPF66_10100 [Bacteroidaceae bacterium]|nr:hypothetical protein [Bacteroidaceae bacterium]